MSSSRSEKKLSFKHSSKLTMTMTSDVDNSKIQRISYFHVQISNLNSHRFNVMISADTVMPDAEFAYENNKSTISLSRSLACLSSSSWWRTPSRALPYWRPDAKYLSPLPSSMLCGPRSSVTVGPPQSFSAKWFLDDRRVSSSQMVDVVRQRWHDGGFPQDSTGPGARRTSTGRTWPFQRL